MDDLWMWNCNKKTEMADLTHMYDLNNHWSPDYPKHKNPDYPFSTNEQYVT